MDSLRLGFFARLRRWGIHSNVFAASRTHPSGAFSEFAGWNRGKLAFLMSWGIRSDFSAFGKISIETFLMSIETFSLSGKYLFDENVWGILRALVVANLTPS